MSVTINYATKAHIPFEYEDELEGEICIGNMLEMGPLVHSTLNDMLEGLGVEHDFSGDVGERINPMAIIEAVYRWDGERLTNGMMAHMPYAVQARRIAKIGMIATSCYLNGIDFVYA